jgi:hypothetical protein
VSEAAPQRTAGPRRRRRQPVPRGLLQLRVSDAERTALRRRAGELGVSVSRLLVESALADDGASGGWSARRRAAVEARAGPLAAASRSLARSAQIRTPPSPRVPVLGSASRTVARTLLSTGSLGLSNRAFLTQLANLSQALHDSHRAALEADRASDLLVALREQLPGAAAAVSAAQPGRQPAPASSGVPARSADRGHER